MAHLHTILSVVRGDDTIQIITTIWLKQTTHTPGKTKMSPENQWLENIFRTVLKPWASTTIEIMVDPIPMIKTLRCLQWWLY